MIVRSVATGVLIALTALSLVGCREWNSKPTKEASAKLAVRPDRERLLVTSDYVNTAIHAVGGLTAWSQCRELTVKGVVAAYESDGSYYLTEQTFRLFPWSHAAQISAHEPQSDYFWQLIGNDFRLIEGNPNVDVSPLKGNYHDFAEAVLQIMTTPAQLLEPHFRLVRSITPMRIEGRPYHAIEARPESRSRTALSNAQPYLAERIYYQDETNGRIDVIWIGNGRTVPFMVVRGYDYASVSLGVKIPTKIEVFRADAAAHIQERLAQVDVKL
jgi:hypothetical protein